MNKCLRIRRTTTWIAFTAFVLLIISTFLTGWPLIWWYHDFLSWRFEQSLCSIEFAQDTKVLASQRRIGILWGCGNHLDIQVMTLIETSLDIAYMSERFYNSVSLQRPFSSGETYVSVIRTDGRKYFEVYDGKEYLIPLDGPDKGIPDAPCDAYWDSGDLQFIEKICSMMPAVLTENKYYYILVACDQVYTGWNMHDFRAQ